jgi:hypothetical protein
VRVRELHETGKWHDSINERSNTPYGESSHWTRPLDVLLLGGAACLTALADFETALYVWGAVLNPILFVFTCLILFWAGRPLLREFGRYLTVAFIAGSLGVLAYFWVARPDHHSVLLLLFAVVLGFAFRLIEEPFSVRSCFLAGAVAGLSMWVCVESQVMIAVTVVTFAILWVVRDRDFLLKNLCFSGALFAFTCLALAVERPWKKWFAVEYERLSIAHCGLFGLVMLVWVAIYLLRRLGAMSEDRVPRMGILSICGLISAVTLWLLFPGLFNTPRASFDPLFLRVWLPFCPETRPLLSSSRLLSVPLLAAILVSLPFLTAWSTRSPQRASWLYISTMLGAFFVLALHQKRWVPYAQILVAFPLAQLATNVWMWMAGRAQGSLRASLGVAYFTVCLCALPAAGLTAATFRSPRQPGSSRGVREASLASMCEYLEHSSRWRSRHLRIVTNGYFGAEILYRTRHSVVGSVRPEGIAENYRILTARDDRRALESLRKRGIDIILVSPASAEALLFCPRSDPDTLYRKLCEGLAPSWCRAVPLPDQLAVTFRLFEVRKL